jgi:hypothetical protein
VVENYQRVIASPSSQAAAPWLASLLLCTINQQVGSTNFQFVTFFFALVSVFTQKRLTPSLVYVNVIGLPQTLF